ncbi:hypothetical protein A2U01_0048595 [Trifolium medium]|uniref:Uncharacterized protein n=1 Tax=Trifolium medium TaxID=97028 RepID=A0A392QTR9_9FABA|nr:hypothetical protein [Trifolium medium]
MNFCLFKIVVEIEFDLFMVGVDVHVLVVVVLVVVVEVHEMVYFHEKMFVQLWGLGLGDVQEKIGQVLA